MHSANITRVFSRMTKAARRRLIVRCIELSFWMVVLSAGSVGTALAISGCLKLLGVG